MIGPTRQLPLPFPHAPHYDSGHILPAPSNSEALQWLAPGADWPGLRLVLWGEAGAGKTHLLHLWRRRHGAALLDGAALRGLPAFAHPALAVDDADLAHDEHALLHLLNAANEAGQPVLLSARTPPARWKLRLPDLASRLRATTAVELRRPEDELLRALLARLLAERQLAVDPGVQDWLLARLPRTAAAMREAAGQLDRLALAAGGPATRAVAARVAAAFERDESDEPSKTAPPAYSCGGPALL